MKSDQVNPDSAAFDQQRSDFSHISLEGTQRQTSDELSFSQQMSMQATTHRPMCQVID